MSVPECMWSRRKRMTESRLKKWSIDHWPYYIVHPLFIYLNTSLEEAQNDVARCYRNYDYFARNKLPSHELDFYFRKRNRDLKDHLEGLWL